MIKEQNYIKQVRAYHKRKIANREERSYEFALKRPETQMRQKPFVDAAFSQYMYQHDGAPPCSSLCHWKLRCERCWLDTLTMACEDTRFSREEANIKLWSNFLPRYRTIRLVTACYLSLICGGQLPRIFLKMTTIEETSPSGEVMMCRLDNEGVEERRVCHDVLYCFIDQQLLSGILLFGLSSASKTNVRRCFISRDESRPKWTAMPLEGDSVKGRWNYEMHESNQ